MGFYLFKLETIKVIHKRGKVPDDDIVTFAVMINGGDRGHGSGFFPAMVDGTEAHTWDITPEGFQAYPAKHTFNMSSQKLSEWQIGPLETSSSDTVDVVYTATNMSDYGLSSLDTKKQDDMEIKILDTVAKKFVGLVAGAGLGEELGGLFSDAFNKAFEDPVGELIGYRQLGPCNGPVFSGVTPFRGSQLDGMRVGTLSYVYYPGTPYPETHTSPFPGARYTITGLNDEATHDTNICGELAVTDVTFSVSRLPFVSLYDWFGIKFPGVNVANGLWQAVPPGTTTIGIKSLLGITP
jgi:hypothetical protein